MKLVWLVGVLWPLELNLKSFRANLKAIHRLDSTLGGESIVVRNEAETFTQTGDFVDENLGRDDVAKWSKHLDQVGVCDVIGEVIDEQVGTLRTYNNV